MPVKRLLNEIRRGPRCYGDFIERRGCLLQGIEAYLARRAYSMEWTGGQALSDWEL